MAKAKKLQLPKLANLWDRLAPFLLIATIALAFVVGVLWQKVENLAGGTGKNTPTAQQPSGTPNPKLSAEAAKKIPAVSDKDHIRGSRDAAVIIIEYSDLECPFCSRFHPTMQQVRKEYSDKVAWVYRHFPLDTIHPKARPAAIAAECVAREGGEDAFWNFVDKIFADQTNALSNLAGVAQAVGVNSAAFKKCTEAKETETIVKAQADGGTQAGVTGTPANFIINKKGEAWLLPGAYPFESLKPIIDAALK